MAEVFHGGGLDAAIARYGGNRKSWIDLSTGINPNPYPVGPITPEVIHRLPDSGAEERLRDAARAYYRVPDHLDIVAMNGTQAVIEQLPQLTDEHQVSIVSPTYGEHSHVWSKNGRKVERIARLSDLQQSSAGVLVVVNPNNPDCRIHPTSELEKAAGKIALLIVDEAFCDSMPSVSILPEMPDNAVVLKSFGKFFGLAGLRLGFAICHPDKAEVLRQRIGPWAVSGLALEIGAAALADQDWTGNTIERLERCSRQLALLLSNSDLEVVGENPLFVYARHKQAQEIHKHLAKHNILARPFPDNPEYLRFGLCRDQSQMRRLKNALESFTDV